MLQIFQTVSVQFIINLEIHLVEPFDINFSIIERFLELPRKDDKDCCDKLEHAVSDTESSSF